MSVDHPAQQQQKPAPQTPADKTDAPRRVREESLSLLGTGSVVCVQSSSPLSEVIEQMKRDERGCAIVCDGERVVGLFTEQDYLTKVIGEEVDRAAPVSAFASPVAGTLAPDGTIGDAVRSMNESDAQCIPLVQDDKVTGAVSAFDVITYLAESYPKETMNLPPVPAQIMDTEEGG